MGQIFTQADVDQLLNQPGTIHLRPYESADPYSELIFTNAASFEYAPEVFTQDFDSAAGVYDAIAQEPGTVNFAYGKVLDVPRLQMLSGGLYTTEVQSAGAKVVENQVIGAGWTSKSPITLNLVGEESESYAGTFFAANGSPAITSVTASVSGALVNNDDFIIVRDFNSVSGYSIVLNSNGTKEVASSETITIVYDDPIMKGETTLWAGGKTNFLPLEGYFKTYEYNGREARIYFHRGFFSQALNITFGTDASPEAAVTNVTINLKKDPRYPMGKQIWHIWKAA